MVICAFKFHATTSSVRSGEHGGGYPVTASNPAAQPNRQTGPVTDLMRIILDDIGILTDVCKFCGARTQPYLACSPTHKKRGWHEATLRSPHRSHYA